MDDLINFMLGAILGWSLCRFWMSFIFRSLLDDLGVKDSQLKDLLNKTVADEPRSQSVIDIEVEMVGSRLYAYRRDTNTFLGYGDSAKELVDVLVKKLPTGTKVQCAKENGAHHLEPALQNLPTE